MSRHLGDRRGPRILVTALAAEQRCGRGSRRRPLGAVFEFFEGLGGRPARRVPRIELRKGALFPLAGPVPGGIIR